MSKKEIEHISIENIQNPEFLKQLSYKELDVLSSDIKDYILKVISEKGGHLSSNLGVIDATIALCRVFDFSKDKIIFDVGHQCYTYKILTGRPLTNFREKDGISGFQKRSESIYDCYEAGHSSTSISAANGFALARRINKEDHEIVAFIGDASIANGMAIEALNNAAGRDKIIIVVNDNEMSISKPVGGISSVFRKLSISSFYRKTKKAYSKIMSITTLGKWIFRFTAKFKNFFKRHAIRQTTFEHLGYNVLGPIDGHDIKLLERQLKKAKKLEDSTIVLIKTIKGKGYPYAENDEVGKWHGVSKFNVETGKREKDNNKSWSSVYGELLYEKMRENQKTVTVCPATELGSCLTKVFKEYPERCFDVGIAEEHCVTMSSALSLSGLHPVISMYSTFLQRSYDQISHDIARMNCDSTLLIDRAGLVGKDGETHQGIYDEQFLLGIPNVTVAMASSPIEAKELFEESFKSHGPFFIRYPKECCLETENSGGSGYGKWKMVTKSGKTAIIAVGPVVNELKAAMNDKKIDVTLVNAIYQKPLDSECLSLLNGYDKIIVYNPYSVVSGFAQSVAAELIRLGYKGELILKAIPDTFVKQATIEEQRAEYKITVKDIIELL